jgi:hypothetical protein
MKAIVTLLKLMCIFSGRSKAMDIHRRNLQMSDPFHPDACPPASYPLRISYINAVTLGSYTQAAISAPVPLPYVVSGYIRFQDKAFNDDIVQEVTQEIVTIYAPNDTDYIALSGTRNPDGTTSLSFFDPKKTPSLEPTGISLNLNEWVYFFIAANKKLLVPDEIVSLELQVCRDSLLCPADSGNQYTFDSNNLNLLSHRVVFGAKAATPNPIRTFIGQVYNFLVQRVTWGSMVAFTDRIRQSISGDFYQENFPAMSTNGKTKTLLLRMDQTTVEDRTFLRELSGLDDNNYRYLFVGGNKMHMSPLNSHFTEVSVEELGGSGAQVESTCQAISIVENVLEFNFFQSKVVQFSIVGSFDVTFTARGLAAESLPSAGFTFTADNHLFPVYIVSIIERSGAGEEYFGIFMKHDSVNNSGTELNVGTRFSFCDYVYSVLTCDDSPIISNWNSSSSTLQFRFFIAVRRLPFEDPIKIDYRVERTDGTDAFSWSKTIPSVYWQTNLSAKYFRMGMGNIRGQPCSENVISFFRFEFRDLFIGHGATLIENVSTACFLTPTTGVQTFYGGAVSDQMTTTCSAGYSNFLSGCQEPEVSGDCLHQGAICSRCKPGFYVNLGGTCTPCPNTNCHRCTENRCLLCKVGHVKNGNGDCDPVGAIGSEEIYLPKLQTIFNGATTLTPADYSITSSPPPAESWLLTRPFQVTGESSIFIHACLEIGGADKEFANAYYPFVLGLIENTVETVYQVKQFSREKYFGPTQSFCFRVQIFSFSKASYPVNLNMFIRGKLSTVTLLELKMRVQAYDPVALCLVEDIYGKCLRCNRSPPIFVYMEKNQTCQPLPLRKYVQWVPYESGPDQFGQCYDSSYLRCKGNKINDALLCDSGYLNQNGVCTIECPASCLTCDLLRPDCLTCPPGNLWLPTTGLYGTCHVICPPGTVQTAQQTCVVDPVVPIAITATCSFHPNLPPQNPPQYKIIFSKPFRFDKLSNRYELLYDRSKMNIDLNCFETPSNRDQTVCKANVNFLIDKTELRDLEIRFLVQDNSEVLSEPKTVLNSNGVVNAAKFNYYMDEQATKTAATVAQIGSTSSQVVSAISAGGSPSWFSSILKMTQSIELLTLFNVAAPANQANFIKIFSDNPFDVLLNPFDYLEQGVCVVNEVFELQGHQCLFLQNNGSLVALVLALVLIHLLLSLVARLCSKTKAGPLLARLKAALNIGFYLMVIDSMFFEVVLAAYINIKKLTDSSPYSLANLVLSFFSIAAAILFHLGTICYIYYQKEDGDKIEPSPENKLKARVQRLMNSFEAPFVNEGIDRKQFLGRYKIAIGQLKVLVDGGLVSFAFDYPAFQVYSITALQFVYTLVYAIKRPFENKAGLIKFTLIEGLLCSSMILTSLYLESPKTVTSQEDRYNYVAMFVIVQVSIIFAVSIIWSLYDMGSGLVKYCKKRKQSQNRIEPVASESLKQDANKEEKAEAKPSLSKRIQLPMEYKSRLPKANNPKILQLINEESKENVESEEIDSPNKHSGKDAGPAIRTGPEANSTDIKHRGETNRDSLEEGGRGAFGSGTHLIEKNSPHEKIIEGAKEVLKLKPIGPVPRLNFSTFPKPDLKKQDLKVKTEAQEQATDPLEKKEIESNNDKLPTKRPRRFTISMFKKTPAFNL